jgi:adenosylcobinamide amidohydrolase
VNLVATATEAKTQALLEAGIPGTGTATDAVCIVSPIPARADDERDPFGGPRSPGGAALARAVHAAVRDGAIGSRRRIDGDPGPIGRDGT